VTTRGRDAPYLYEATLRDPMPPGVPPGSEFAVSSVAVADSVIVHSVAMLTRAGNGDWQ